MAALVEVTVALADVGPATVSLAHGTGDDDA